MEESDTASWFCAGLRTGASGEIVSPPTAGFHNAPQWSGVYVGIFFFFFLKDSMAGTPRNTCVFFSSKCSKICRRRASTKSYLTPKVDPMLKLSCYKASSQVTHVLCTNVQMTTPFWEIDPDCTRALRVPAKPLSFFFISVRPNFWISLKTQISHKIEKNVSSG